MKCLERWVYNADVDGRLLGTSEVFTFCLGALDDVESFEQATDTCTSIWRQFRCSEMSITGALFPRVVALRHKWASAVAPFQASQNGAHHLDNEEDLLAICRGICRLATETAEACLPLVVSDDNYGQMELMELLVHCAAFKYDFGIARIPLNFFYTVCRSIRYCKNPSSSSYSGSGTLSPDPGDDAEYYFERDRVALRFGFTARML